MSDLPTSANSILAGDNDPQAARAAKAKEAQEILQASLGAENILSVGAGIGTKHAHQFVIVMARGYSRENFADFGLGRDDFRKKPTEPGDTSTMWFVDERVIDRIIESQKAPGSPEV